MNLKERGQAILDILKKTYTRKADSFVIWKTPLQMVVGTILSAQCTDKRVNMVLPVLFKHYKTAHDFSVARLPSREVPTKTGPKSIFAKCSHCSSA